jgi:hypothetical protein
MDDSELLSEIHRLVDHEHRLRERAAGTELPEKEQRRLQELEVALDQCWDLLRQRRAKREVGANPDEADVRDPGTVEGYRQ